MCCTRAGNRARPKGLRGEASNLGIRLEEFRAALDGAAGNTTIAASIAHSPTRTIVAGLLMFLSVSIAGVLFARSSSFGRARK